jgi:hypothetical protein
MWNLDTIWPLLREELMMMSWLRSHSKSKATRLCSIVNQKLLTSKQRQRSWLTRSRPEKKREPEKEKICRSFPKRESARPLNAAKTEHRDPPRPNIQWQHYSTVCCPMADCAAEEPRPVHVSPNRPWAGGQATFQFQLVSWKSIILMLISILSIAGWLKGGAFIPTYSGQVDHSHQG